MQRDRRCLAVPEGQTIDTGTMTAQCPSRDGIRVTQHFVEQRLRGRTEEVIGPEQLKLGFQVREPDLLQPLFMGSVVCRAQWHGPVALQIQGILRQQPVGQPINKPVKCLSTECRKALGGATGLGHMVEVGLPMGITGRLTADDAQHDGIHQAGQQ